MANNLFRSGMFELHSGEISSWLIDCDALTAEDWSTLALLVAEEIGEYSDVVGIPTVGLPFAKALRMYATDSGPVLIVDDVLTTGASMEAEKAELHKKGLDEGGVLGVVVFARGNCPSWIKPIFKKEDW